MKKSGWILVIVILLPSIVIMLGGCDGKESTPKYPRPAPITDDDFTILYNSGSNVIYRFVDDQTNVVCWIYTGFEKGGMSCLPLTEVEKEHLR